MNIKKATITVKMNEIGAFAVVRGTVARTLEIAEGLKKGGIPCMEISFTNNDAGEAIKAVKEKYGDDMIVGAGTVLDAQTARIAILSGADFIISCNGDEDVAKLCNRYQIPYGPGCTTVTEAINGLTWGAAFIKAFPISNFYGPKLAKIFKTPTPFMPIMASGGITLDNITEWLQNGVDFLGMGGLLTNGTVDEIAANAAKVREIIDTFRAGNSKQN